MTKEEDLEELRTVAELIDLHKGNLDALYARRRGLWIRRYEANDTTLAELADVSNCLHQNVSSAIPAEVREARRVSR
jgi:hypothetical protein